METFQTILFSRSGFFLILVFLSEIEEREREREQLLLKNITLKHEGMDVCYGLVWLGFMAYQPL